MSMDQAAGQGTAQSGGAGALTSPTPASIRDELTDMVVRDLLGPAGGPEEELNQYEDHVYGRYLVGMLAPKSSEIPGGELDDLSTTGGDEGEEGAPDSGTPPVGTYFPSSMGMSFVVTSDMMGDNRKVRPATNKIPEH
jgi:hypothetical protein